MSDVLHNRSSAASGAAESAKACGRTEGGQKTYTIEEIARLLNQMTDVHAAILAFMVKQGVTAKRPGVEGLADAFTEAVKKAAKKRWL